MLLILLMVNSGRVANLTKVGNPGFDKFPTFNRMKYFAVVIVMCCCLHLAGQENNSYKVIAYYTGNGEAIRQYPVGKLTHIIYSFLKLQTIHSVFITKRSGDHWNNWWH